MSHWNWINNVYTFDEACKKIEELQAELAEKDKEIKRLESLFSSTLETEAKSIAMRMCGVDSREQLAEKDKAIREAIKYCENYAEHMWAAKTISLLIGCDFRDSKQEARCWLEKYGENK